MLKNISQRVQNANMNFINDFIILLKAGKAFS